jgi:hypothetical protein
MWKNEKKRIAKVKLKTRKQKMTRMSREIVGLLHTITLELSALEDGGGVRRGSAVGRGPQRVGRLPVPPAPATHELVVRAALHLGRL